MQGHDDGDKGRTDVPDKSHRQQIGHPDTAKLRANRNTDRAHHGMATPTVVGLDQNGHRAQTRDAIGEVRGQCQEQ